MEKRTIKLGLNAVIILLIVIGAGYVLSRFVHLGNVAYTDNAQVYRHITSINSRISGFIKEIRFDDYQYVHKGDTLVIIEDAEYRLHLAQAEASCKGTKTGANIISAGMETTQSNVQVASAGIEEARVNMQNALDDYNRFKALLEKDAVTKQQYDNAKTRYEAAKARYEQVSQQKHSTALVRNQQAQQLNQNSAGVSVAEAQVNLARLNLSYTVIVATCDGMVGKKDIHEGQLVQPGMKMCDIIDNSNVWVIANYREKQLANIKEGADVKITVDAIPGVEYKGKVEKIADATGAAFGHMPQDNATGNFVKIQQRVPVRITLNENDKEALKKLKAGLNVECETSLSPSQGGKH